MEHEDIAAEAPSSKWLVHRRSVATVSIVALLGLGAISCRMGPADLARSEDAEQVDDSLGQGTGRRLRESFEEGGFVTNADQIKTFPWTKPTRTTQEAFNAAFPNGQGFWNVNFKEGHSKAPITAKGVVSWVDEELLKGKNPFAEYHGKVPIPWVTPSSDGVADDQLAPGNYVGYSRRQVCYIVAQSLLGADTDGYRNGLHRFMFKWAQGGCQPQSSGFGKSWWAFLAACSDDPTLKDGGQGPMLIAAKAHPAPDAQMLKELSDHFPLADSGFRLCRYDDGAIADQDYLPGVPRTPASMCKQPTADAPGVDFMSTSAVKGQALQYMSAELLGGYAYGNSCDVGGGQDERTMLFMPEVSALVFFLSQAKTPELRQPAWIMGARMLISGLDGTGRFNSQLAPDEWARMHSDLAKVQVQSKRFKVSTSKPLVGFMSENQGMVPFNSEQWKIAKARLNQLPDQRDGSPTGKYAFRNQIAQWYRSVALESYSSDLHEMMKKVVKSVGSGPWMAGLWFGDSQVGVLAMWIGQALAVQSWGGSGALPLDYYLYSKFTENAGNQCFVHSKAACQKCLWTCNRNKPAPKTWWMPSNALMSNGDGSNPCVVGGDNSCSVHGLEDVMWNFGMKHAGDLWSITEHMMNWHRGDVSHSLFDLIMQQLTYDRMAGIKPPSM